MYAVFFDSIPTRVVSVHSTIEAARAAVPLTSTGEWCFGFFVGLHEVVYGVAIASVGTRRGWPYQAASLYTIRTTADGRQIWQLHSHGTWRTAGAQVLSRDALELCREYACKFYGKRSLHNREYFPNALDVVDARV